MARILGGQEAPPQVLGAIKEYFNKVPPGVGPQSTNLDIEFHLPICGSLRPIAMEALA